MMRKVLAILIIAVAVAVPFFCFDFLPDIGDPMAPPNTRTSDYYIEHAIPETHAPNMVTAVIVDYRAYDTMLETTVMFLAGLGVVLILSRKPKPENRIQVPDQYPARTEGTPAYQTINKSVVITLLEPLLMIYGIYVLFHGEVSLGGGFQAGALFGLTYVIDVMVMTDRKNLMRLGKEGAVALAGVGTFIYVLGGILCLFGGGLFLEYATMPLIHEAERHPTGMLIVEIGVAICVMATIITILNGIMERARWDDDTN